MCTAEYLHKTEAKKTSRKFRQRSLITPTDSKTQTDVADTDGEATATLDLESYYQMIIEEKEAADIKNQQVREKEEQLLNKSLEETISKKTELGTKLLRINQIQKELKKQLDSVKLKEVKLLKLKGILRNNSKYNFAR